jgi:hypothetical protein
MTASKIPPTPAVRECPVCHFPLTKIQRRLDGDRHGATNYVCSRAGECALGFNLSKVENWVAV